MQHFDLYTTLTLLFAVALAVMGVQILLKRIPQAEEFAKLRIMKGLVASIYLLVALFDAIEFTYWDKYDFETAAFLNLSCTAYVSVLCLATIITYFNPAYTTKRRIALWLGITSLWVVPLGIFNYLNYPWAVYAAFAAYILQITVGFTFFHRKFREGLQLIKATDTEHKINLRRLSFGTWYLLAYCVGMAVVSCLPPVVHNVFTLCIAVGYLLFATRFGAFADRLYQEYFPILTDAGLTDSEPTVTDESLKREAHCREKVEQWVAAQGYTKGDLSSKETAEDMGLSEEDLKWYFAVCLNEDMRSWRVNLRIELAKEILKCNPDAPINELAKSVGFRSYTNIYSYFKKYYGVTPREYGAQNQKDDLENPR